MDAEAQAVVELRQADEDEREEGLAVPLEVGEQVQVPERGVGHQVGLVQDDGHVQAVLARAGRALALNALEHAGRRRLGLDAQRVAELPVEVAAAKRDVGRVLDPVRGGGEVLAQGAEHAGLADTGVADDEGVLAMDDGLGQALEGLVAAAVHPHQVGRDVLVEGLAGEAEGLLYAVTHLSSPWP